MIVIALGANLPSKSGPPIETMNAALVRLRRHGIKTLLRSSFYLADAVPAGSGPRYHNAAAIVDAPFGPAALMQTLQSTEIWFGRRRLTRNEPRLLDLDLIDFHGLQMGWDVEIMASGAVSGLVLPHPRAHLRGFVLRPIKEIAPGWKHPVFGKSAFELLEMGPNTQKITRLP
jgi:2-amino-4-hydroxy-6-hydroxymethyldihydropteridine diphosphokinase